MNTLVKGFNTINNLFTKKECKEYLKYIDENKDNFDEIKYHGRNCHQLTKENEKSKEFAKEIYKRISQHLPEYFVDDFGDKWHPRYCNPRIRITRYEKDCFFDWHHDGYIDLNETHRTMASVTIILNSVPKENGGATIILDGEDKSHILHVQPVAGNAFMIDITTGPEHKGDVLLDGEKYIMRTDVVCELIEAKNKEIRIEYYNVLKQIEELEDEMEGLKSDNPINNNNVNKIMKLCTRVFEIESTYKSM